MAFTKLKLKNNDTGEIVEVPIQEVAKYGINAIDAVKQLEAQTQLDNIAAGKPGELTADQKKKQFAANASLNLIGRLEGEYQTAKGGQKGGIEGRIGGKLSSILGGLGLSSSAKTYEDTKTGFAASLKQLTGDVGVLTDKDYARLSKLLPELGATPEEARKKFNNLRSQLAASYGGEQTETSVYDENPNDELLKGLVQPFKRTGQNIIGAGQAVAGLAAEKTGNQEIANKLYGANILGSQERIQKANTDPLGLAGEQTIDSGSILLDALGLKGLGKVKGTKVSLPKTFSKSALSTARESSYKLYPDVKVAGKTIADVGDDFVTRNPEFKEIGKEILPELKKRSLTPKNLVEQIHDWSSGTYTKAGDVRSAQLAKFHNVLANAGRKQLKNFAPETAKVNTLFSKLYGREALAKKLAYTGAGGLATSLGGFALYKLFGGGER